MPKCTCTPDNKNLCALGKLLLANKKLAFTTFIQHAHTGHAVGSPPTTSEWQERFDRLSDNYQKASYFFWKHINQREETN